METVSEWLDRRERMARSNAIAELLKRRDMQSPFRGHSLHTPFSFFLCVYLTSINPFLPFFSFTQLNLLPQMTTRVSTRIRACRGGRARFRRGGSISPQQSLWEPISTSCSCHPLSWHTNITHDCLGWWRPRDPPQEIARCKSQCQLNSACYCHGKSQTMLKTLKDWQCRQSRYILLLGGSSSKGKDLHQQEDDQVPGKEKILTTDDLGSLQRKRHMPLNTQVS